MCLKTYLNTVTACISLHMVLCIIYKILNKVTEIQFTYYADYAL